MPLTDPLRGRPATLRLPVEARGGLPAPPESAPAEVIGLLQAILDAVRGLRSDLRRQAAPDADALVAALDAYFGPSRFTVAGIFDVVDDDPHGELAAAVGELVDMNMSLRSRSTALGMLLRRMEGVEAVAEQRGCSVYRVRTSDE